MLKDKTVTNLLVTTEAVIRDLDRWEYEYEQVNGACVYADERGAPSCLIGHVLYRWRALTEEVTRSNNIASDALSALGANVEVQAVANVIQSKQDLHETWGEALRAGHAYARGEGLL